MKDDFFLERLDYRLSNIDDEPLIHYGVKGMRWGVRKKDDSPNPKYSQRSRTTDLRAYGKGGVKRINRMMNNGYSHAKAARTEHRNARIKAAAISGGLIAAYAVNKYGPTAMHLIAVRAETNRGLAKIPALMDRAAKLSYSKKNRQGVYNITTL